MKRLLVLSMLSLAPAGCAQSKGALSRGASYPPSPVALTPVPSIYDTVNTGVGGEALAQTAIKNLDDPHWSGRAQVSVAARPVPPGLPNPPGGPGPRAGGRRSACRRGLGRRAAAARAGPPIGAAPAPAALAAAPVAAALPVASALPQSGGQGPDCTCGVPLQRRAGWPGRGDWPGGRSRALSLSAAPATNDAGTPPLDSTSNAAKLTAASPVDAAVSPSASAAPAAAPAVQSPAPLRGRDPLLGPDPDLLPAMPDLPSVNRKSQTASSAGWSGATGSCAGLDHPGTSARRPAATRSNAGPAPRASPQPDSAEPPSPGLSAPADQPTGADKSTAIARPATAGLAAVGSVARGGTAARPVVATAKTACPSRPARPATAWIVNVVLASSEEPKSPRKDHKSVYKEPGGPVARVGDEIITYHDLIAAFKENLRKYPQLRGDGFNSAEQMQINRDKDMLARQTLAGLIDRTLLAQEAKRHIKDKKMIDRLYEEADKIWHTEEVLPLQRQYNVDSESKLKEALAEEGRSLDTMRQSFRQYFLAETYLHEKLRDRIKVELPDLLRYYNEHLHDHEFDRPAQITWRELVVEVEKYKSREEARKKADALLEKLRRGADFQQLARAESDGPTSSRKQGGLMKTTPGSYAVKSINDALDSLPIGQVSGVLEGPDSFHVLKVENRRPAGPASFEEIQDQIKPALENQKYRDERVAFVAKLQKNTLISIYNLGMDDSKKQLSN